MSFYGNQRYGKVVGTEICKNFVHGEIIHFFYPNITFEDLQDHKGSIKNAFIIDTTSHYQRYIIIVLVKCCTSIVCSPS